MVRLGNTEEEDGTSNVTGKRSGWLKSAKLLAGPFEVATVA
jgi:hypothetical protein